ncbi:unnamed protein product, partial [Natator depressus]
CKKSLSSWSALRRLRILSATSHSEELCETDTQDFWRGTCSRIELTGMEKG